ncbi:MAG: RDD family protein [Pyrinomonadaceae bacterium]
MGRYQTFGKRFIASIVDTLVFSPLIIFYFWIGAEGTYGAVYIVSSIVGSLIGLSYNVLMHWAYGQTLGKMAVKVKVVDSLTERPISLSQALLRDIVNIASEAIRFAMFGYLLFLGLSMVSEPFASLDLYASLLFLAWYIVNTVVCLKHPKNRAIHDMIATTVVVRLDIPSEEIANLQLEPPRPDSYEDLGDPRY